MGIKLVIDEETENGSKGFLCCRRRANKVQESIPTPNAQNPQIVDKAVHFESHSFSTTTAKREESDSANATDETTASIELVYDAETKMTETSAADGIPSQRE